MNCSLVFLVLLAVAGLVFYLRRLNDKIEADRQRLNQIEIILSRLRDRVDTVPASDRTADEVADQVAAEDTDAPGDDASQQAQDVVDMPPLTAAAIRTAAPLEREIADPPPAVSDEASSAEEDDAEPSAPEETASAEPPASQVPDLLPPSPPSPPPPSRPRVDVDWERWIGVRGAALLGAVVLAFASFLFLRYSLEAGWIAPIVRVTLGFLVGVGTIVAAERLRPSGYTALADALAGSGIVILYAATWAARSLYDLIPALVAFGLMSLITVTCGLLSWRHHSLVTALIGLVGGFATPLLLSTGSDNPIGLFGYLLLLNVGLSALARRRGWPILGLLGVGATAFYQALWIFVRMTPERALLGLGILAIFGLFFSLSGRISLRSSATQDHQSSRWTLLAQLSGLLAPFAFAVYFAANAELGRHLLPLAALLLLLSLAAEFLAGVHRVPLLAAGVAVADVAIVAVWTVRTSFDAPLAWEAVAVAVLLAAVYQGSLEWRSQRTGPVSWASVIAAGGFLGWLALVPVWAEDASFWPWFAAWVVLAGLLLRQAVLGPFPWRQPLAAAGLGVGLTLATLLVAFAGDERASLPTPPLFFVLTLAVVAALQIWAVFRDAPADPAGDGPTRADRGRRYAEIAAALLPIIILFGLLLAAFSEVDPLLFLGFSILMAFFAVLAATRLPSGLLYLGSMLLLATVHLAWTEESGTLSDNPNAAALGFALQAVAVVLFTFWPLVSGGRLRQRSAWYAAALAGPVWFSSLRSLFELRFGTDLIAVLPVALGVASLTAAYGSRRRLSPADPQLRRNLVWFSAVAMGFLALAIPLQLDREWITIGWALQGFGLIALWQRLDHPGLKYFGLALLGAATVRLIANPALLGYHAESYMPVINWLMYTYLVPAAALLGAAATLRPTEVERQRDFESPLYARGWPVGAVACSLAAIAVVFVWINLTILDFFSSGPGLDWSWQRLPARDLTLSAAWALYALGLLALGLVRRNVGLRWISLGFLVLTIGKVFLYDLGELTDLYRVASLVGLAMSLILVSLLYQRFVFRRQPAEEE